MKRESMEEKEHMENGNGTFRGDRTFERRAPWVANATRSSPSTA